MGFRGFRSFALLCPLRLAFSLAWDPICPSMPSNSQRWRVGIAQSRVPNVPMPPRASSRGAAELTYKTLLSRRLVSLFPLILSRTFISPLHHPLSGGSSYARLHLKATSLVQTSATMTFTKRLVASVLQSDGFNVTGGAPLRTRPPSPVRPPSSRPSSRATADPLAPQNRKRALPPYMMAAEVDSVDYSSRSLPLTHVSMPGAYAPTLTSDAMSTSGSVGSQRSETATEAERIIVRPLLSSPPPAQSLIAHRRSTTA